MTHLDPETLALLALGEDAATATQRLHLAGCEQCRAEVARFARAVAATRNADEPLAQPAPQVWTGIAEALDLPADLAADPLGGVGPRRVAGPLRRRRRSLVAVLLAAAAVLVLGGVGVGLLTARHQAEPLATAALHAFPNWKGDSGTAVLERLPDGKEVVQVTTTVRPDGTTDHEVWLMTAGAKRLVSLGLLHGTSGTFTVPAGVDVSRFRLVDVSDEPRDGNPAHSGDSIIRGALKS
jgi:hypothetical protein